MTLKLKIPSISEKPDPDVEIRGVYVEEWIEALPFANPDVMVRNLLDTVSQLNRSPLKPTARLALMELYAQPYHYLKDLQEKHGASRTAAAFEKHRLESDAIRRIAGEMAYGYKIVVATSIGKKSIFGKNKELTVALQRAVLFLAFALMHSYDEYLPSPVHLWGELLELYSYAKQGDLENQSIAGNTRHDGFQSTIANTYKRILLTSLVDPFHLAQGDIWRVFTQMGRWADAARLIDFAEVDKATGFFVVDPGKEGGPSPYADATARGVSELCQLLDANPVIQRIQEALKKEEVTEPSEKFLLGRIARSLGIPPKRHAPRESTGGHVRLTSGITTLHHYLGGGNGAAASEPEAPEAPADEGIEIGDDIGGALLVSGPSYQTEGWNLVNKGPGGVGILRHSRPAISIGVGELIGISYAAETSPDELWSVGVVRWLTIADAGDYYLGIQILSERAQAITVRSEFDGGERAALALPRVAEVKGATLLTPKGCYAKGGTFVVETGAETLRVRVGSLVETADTYDRFSYDLVN